MDNEKTTDPERRKSEAPAQSKAEDYGPFARKLKKLHEEAAAAEAAVKAAKKAAKIAGTAFAEEKADLFASIWPVLEELRVEGERTGRVRKTEELYEEASRRVKTKRQRFALRVRLKEIRKGSNDLA